MTVGQWYNFCARATLFPGKTVEEAWDICEKLAQEGVPGPEYSPEWLEERIEDTKRLLKQIGEE